MGNIIRFKTARGVVLEGEEKEVYRIAREMGEDVYPPSEYHYSESKNDYILIKEMNTRYLMNVLIQKMNPIAQRLDFDSYTLDRDKMLDFFDRMFWKDAELQALWAEYHQRNNDA